MLAAVTSWLQQLQFKIHLKFFSLDGFWGTDHGELPIIIPRLREKKKVCSGLHPFGDG